MQVKSESVRYICWVLLFALLISIMKITIADSYSVVYHKNRVATVKKIESDETELTIRIDFTNKSSSSADFLFSFSLSVYQNGIECSSITSKNAGTNVKDGGSIEVIYVYRLKNMNDIVDIELGGGWFMLDSIHIYFNPLTQLWGDKNEISVSPTPIIDSWLFSKQSDFSWICPSCGKKLNSKFCPDCGISSPTPIPTPVVTPNPQWTCPSCGKLLESKFCPDCGTTSPIPPTISPFSFSTFTNIELGEFYIKNNSLFVPYDVYLNTKNMPSELKRSTGFNIKVKVNIYQDESKTKVLKSDTMSISFSNLSSLHRSGKFVISVSGSLQREMGEDFYCDCDIIN